MEIPDLVQQELGDEEIRGGVNLGDEDAACFTPTRTLVYRGEGLLSDEKVDSYPHDFERLTVSEGRRKTKFSLIYTSEKLELSVPGSRSDAVLERLLEGKLTVSGGIDPDESLAGVFRFSELTLVVTDRQLLKHIGNVSWDADYEAFSFDDVTGLEFEEGSVATAVVLSFNERPERIKAPSEQAPMVRKTLEEALFAYHEVSSLAELNAKVGASSEKNADEAGNGLGLESGIDPLVSNDEQGGDGSEGESTSANTQTTTAATTEQGTTAEATTDSQPSDASGIDTDSAEPDTSADPDVAELEAQVAELTAAVEAQNEQLQKQERTIKQLIKELRQGR
ncbi:DUF7115 domain-containing protein [Haloarcula argentinensis]|uniref:DUF7115 domain-containing protein n=1 Tax=Haloarcula argentinensis TaxID=43776 RepID=A0A830FFH5_HALAR|nr:hypothetical protein [Haloarcula argentinensis]EMA19030.1 hypothetical protein C443_18008 [Haloarcula argentinensis DSM 12282]MDS0254019.1 hypothetical protein [Haloarcula argentinensis]GGM44820.1 hypothetical protein GCM10009006_27710 [Haloarcula argentinensis]